MIKLLADNYEYNINDLPAHLQISLENRSKHFLIHIQRINSLYARLHKYYRDRRSGLKKLSKNEFIQSTVQISSSFEEIDRSIIFFEFLKQLNCLNESNLEDLKDAKKYKLKSITILNKIKKQYS